MIRKRCAGEVPVPAMHWLFPTMQNIARQEQQEAHNDKHRHAADNQALSVRKINERSVYVKKKQDSEALCASQSIAEASVN